MRIANKTFNEVEIIGGNLTTNSTLGKFIQFIDQYSILTAIHKISNECKATLSYDGEKYVVNLEPKGAIN